MRVVVFYFACIIAILNQASCIPDDVDIYGGDEISIEDAPFMVSLRLNGSHQCGGSIIHEQFILTAAHCLLRAREEVTVLVGTEDSTGDSDGEIFGVEKVILHPGFSFRSAHDDIALVKLKKPVIFGPKVAKIEITTTNTTVKIPVGTELNITGWGLAENATEASPKLLQTQGPLVDDIRCQEMYNAINFTITPTVLCAGGGGRGSCNGDSGGPLTFGNVQIGVTSLGLGCGIKPVVYTKVTTFFCWIMEQIYLSQ